MNQFTIPRPTQEQVDKKLAITLPIAAKFVNESSSAITNADAVILKFYLNGEASEEMDFPLTLGAGESKIITMIHLEVGAEKCTGETLSFGAEVVKVNNTTLNNKFTANIKIVEQQAQ